MKTFRFVILISISIGFQFSSHINAQEIDPSFTPSFTVGSSARLVAAQKDGKLLVVGDFTMVNDQATRSFIRVNQDGTLDSSFSFDNSIESRPTAIALQDDGKIIIGGQFRNINDEFVGSILRLNTDGSLDDSFFIISEADATFQEIEILSNQKIFSRYSRCVEGVDVNCHVYGVTLSKPNGEPDDNFPKLEFDLDTNGGSSSSISDITIQSDNALIVAGTKLQTQGFEQEVYRFDSLGNIDVSFNPDIPTISNFIVSSIGVLPDGTMSILSGAGHYVVILDSIGNQIFSDRISLKPSGKGYDNGMIKKYTDDSFLILSRNAAAIIDRDGNISVNTELRTSDFQFIFDCAFTDDAIFIVGNFEKILYNDKSGFVKLNRPDLVHQFELDNSFGTQIVKPGAIYSILQQEDGRIIVAGDFDHVNNVPQSNIARIDQSGNLDTQFRNGINDNLDVVAQAKQLKNGNFLVVGRSEGLRMYNRDGGLIQIFQDLIDPLNGFRTFSYLSIDDAEKVYAGDGTSIHSNGAGSQTLIQYDLSDLNNVIEKEISELSIANRGRYSGLTIDNENNLILHGYGLKYGDSEASPLLKLTSTGEIEENFNPVFSNDLVVRELLENDKGEFFIAGGHRQLSPYSWSGVFRKLNFNGELLFDLSDKFQRDNGEDYSISNIQALPNSQILLQGNFDTFDSNEVESGQIIIDDQGNYLGQLVDNNFSGRFIQTEILEDGSYLLAGDFRNPLGGSSLIKFVTNESSECVSDSINITSQEDVNNFPKNYPDCKNIASLVIKGVDITNLDSLIYLDSVDKGLTIEQTSLTDLEGLEHINFAEATNFQIKSNALLLDIVNISYRSDIDSLVITDNGSLLQISNPGYTSYANVILIDNNESLTGVPFFNDLLGGDEVIVINNPQLNECCGLFDLMDRDDIDSLTLENNGDNCSSSRRLEEFCGYCIDDHIRLSTQEDVDNYRVNHPACKEIHSLRIEGEGITNLDSLYYIESVNGIDLYIANTSLRDLNGLSHAEIDMDVVEIMNNLFLESINLPNLDIRDDLRIIENGSLENLDGLSNLRGVRFIEIAGNSSLLNLNGFSSLDDVMDLIISDNLSLKDITGIRSVIADNLDQLILHGNSSLSDCCILEQYFEYEHPHEEVDFEISANGGGCNSEEEIESSCNETSCEISDLILTTQSEVDAFLTDHPNCHTINSLIIEGAGITNLNGLSNLSNINNRLEIVNTSLVNMSGIEGVAIGFDADIIISVNPLLEYIGSLYFNSEIDTIIIDNNIGLDAIGIFDGLSNLEYLEITDNPILSDIIAIESLEWATSIRIVSNQNLNECCPLFRLLEDGVSELIVGNNGSSCSSEIVIREQCGFCEFPDVHLSTQEDVDNYRLNHAACEEIHSLIIDGEDITNLDSLYHIAAIQGIDVTISNTSITSLNGLSKAIIDVGHFSILNNPFLESIEFENRFFAYMGFEIIDNPALSHIEGMEEIDRVDYVLIGGNTSLVNLDFLSNLQSADEIHISDNNSLVDINGLSNLDRHAVRNIILHGNTKLSECCVLDNLFGEEHGSEISFEISFNAPGCNNEGEIRSTCSEPCEVSELILSTQAEVNAFPSVYPSCNSLSSLTIAGEDITSLDSLYQIRKVFGPIHINNTSIEFIGGVSSISFAEDLTIENNSYLQSVRGFEGINELAGQLIIRNNDAITENSGVNFFDHIGAVIIEDNDALSFIDNFNELKTIESFTIVDNAKLSDCCIVEQLLSLGLDPVNITIENNAEKCTNYDDARTSCNINIPCELEDLTLTSQQQVDDFPINYPNCREIRNIYILGQDIYDLESLYSIERIYGDVSIQGTSLTSLNGLNIDREVYAIHITGNQFLEDLSPLNNVGATQARIIINDNASLAHLNGLSNLTYTGDAISIYGNASLVSIDGLSNLNSLERFYVVDNPNLNECCFISQKIQQGVNTEGMTLSGNADGCLSVENIKATCDDDIDNGGEVRDDCLSESITLRSQEDVDNFSADYPGCNQVSKLVITGLDIENLNGLNNLISVTNYLRIDETSLSDFSSLNDVDLYSLQELVIVDNQILNNLFGINIGEQIERVIVSENPFLLDIQSLSPIRYYEYLEIFGNSSLSICCPIIEALAHEEGRMIVRNNFDGCTSASEVKAVCDIVIEECSDIIYLASQAEVDAFATTYPNCKSVEVLDISGSDVTDLGGLLQLDEVTEILTIGGTSIVSPGELESIDFSNVKNLQLFDNTKMINLAGINVSGDIFTLEISDNSSLNDLSALSGLNSVGSITLNNNEAITSLEGLNNLVGIQSLGIVNNQNLQTLDALLNAGQIEFVSVHNNRQLNECCAMLASITDATFGFVEIYDNLSGCNSSDEVVRVCDPASIDCTEIILNSQSEVDNFQLLFAGCTSTDVLHIDGTDITNLDGISELVNVNREFYLGSTQLTDLDGLAGVAFDSLEIINIYDNDQLTNLNGAMFTGHVLEMNIDENETLNDLSAMASMESVGFLGFSFNNGLEELSGLEGLVSIDYLLITENNRLRNLDNLSSLQNLGTGEFFSNENLSHCCGILESPNASEFIDNLIFSDNAIGCRDNLEVLNECSIDFCLDTDIILSSQEEVDNFNRNYGTCPTLETLNIQGSDITNLDSLYGINEVTNFLIIHNTGLVELNGVSQITTSNLSIIENQSLISIPAWDRLTRLNYLEIGRNENLTNIDGFRNLDFVNEIEIVDNDNLLNIDGLSNMSELGYITLDGNDAITDIDGLENVLILDGIDLYQNASLASCCIIYPEVQTDRISYFIEENAPGCNSDADIISACEDKPIVSCEIDKVVLRNQQEVDDFKSNYGECNSLLSLEIRGNDITNLRGLSDLVEVKEYISISKTQLINFDDLTGVDFGGIQFLIIRGNSQLSDFHGIQSGENLEHIKISDNPELTDLLGLQSLIFSDYLNIENNASLKDLSGLSNVTQVNRLSVVNNRSLRNLSGLENLQMVQTLSVYFNADLQNVDALEKLRAFDLVHLSFNESLSACCGLMLAINSIEEGDYLGIGNNLPGCNSIEDVAEACTDEGLLSNPPKFNIANKNSEIVEAKNQSVFIPNTSKTEDLFKIYPNPFDNNLVVKNLGKNQFGTISIYDIRGSLIMKEEIASKENKLNTASFASGIYLIRIESASFIQTQKLIKN